MIDVAGRIRWIRDRVNHVFDVVTSLLTLQETGGTITTDGTEQEVYRVEDPMGIFEPVKVVIDFSNQTGSEVVVVRTYYRISGSGTFVKKDELSYSGEQDPPLKNVELEPNRHGIRVSLQRLAGSAIAYEWEAHFRS